MKRRRRKPKPGPAKWTKVPITELRGKASFFGCVVEPIPTKHNTFKWLLVVPGQAYMRIVMTRKQRYRTERTALIMGIEWALQNKAY